MEENKEIAQNSAEIEPPLHDENGDFAKGHKKIGGKVKGSKHFKTEIDELLDQLAEGKDYTYRKALLRKVIAKMIIDGDTTLIKEYWQQSDGKPRESVEVDGEIILKISKEIADKYETTPSTSDNSQG